MRLLRRIFVALLEWFSSWGYEECPECRGTGDGDGLAGTCPLCHGSGYWLGSTGRGG